MKKVVPSGKIIKALRLDLEQGATQKEFSHEVRISERKLRQIENESAAITVDVLERIAKVLNVHRERITVQNSAPSENFTASAASERASSFIAEMDQDRLIPRFDHDFANVVKDEHEIYTEAKTCDDSSFEILTALTPETRDYAEELSDILTSLTRSCRNILNESLSDELEVRQRIRQLLVLLKGNDVWVYMTQILRRLPEGFTPMPEGKYPEMKFRLVVAFGPPGKYGETSIRVAVDHGQPFILPAWPKLKARLDASHSANSPTV